jgi:DNA polymerase iota
VGNKHKPNAQTTLLPPYTSVDDNVDDNVTLFMNDHEIGKIPGIGFKIAQKLRAHVLQRPADFDTGLVYGGTKESVLVRDVKQYPGIGPETLERLLGGVGAPHGIGLRIWDLLNGCDNTEVGQAREVPTQISIEDSYQRLVTLSQVTKEMRMLATSLLNRMHTDLLEDEEDDDQDNSTTPSKRWLAHPKTIRLSTRPRPPQNPDGSRNRSFARISKSAPLPAFVFNLKDSVDVIVDRLVNETLLPLFRRLHPEKAGWNLSLMNVAVANMMSSAREKGGVGRDIGKMFRRQDGVLGQWKVDEDIVEETRENEVGHEEDVRMGEDSDEETKHQESEVEQQFVPPDLFGARVGSEDVPTPSQQTGEIVEGEWDSGDEDMDDEDSYRCSRCSAVMPLFAMFAHERFHERN